ncbi:MAG: SWIM zinc finger family protein [Clostridiales bacterium]|jgi:uncharacterized Zn finger protein|nr:SWIM zinc finger family protein [Clostridiales bacterium]MDR2751049.1 SWIM zinc finger family protein [Clostridiales bacterium]
MYYNDSWPAYVPVAERKAKAQIALAKLRKTDPTATPVEMEGRKPAKTWWGQAWVNNLESYADYSNRLPRGKSYLSNGLVIDLKIMPGKVTGVVSGSSPYKVEVTISPLAPHVWKAVTEVCNRQISSLEALASGKFPEELGKLFTSKGGGLFPSPREIKLKCSCPDSAVMCKHVAAVLYGVGTKLDQDPTLFFKLRSVEFDDLIKKSIESKMSSMLKNANQRTGRTMSETLAASVFDI